MEKCCKTGCEGGVEMTDSTLHFLSNLVPTFCLGLVSPTHAVTFSLGLSLGKEAGDWTNYGSDMGLRKFAPMALHDMKYNLIGIAVGVALSLGVRRLFGW